MAGIVSFVGYHNAGKTSFGVKVLEILKRKGYRIGVIKSTKHPKVVRDEEGKDSFRYRSAGADPVAVLSREELVIFADGKGLDPLYLSFLLFSGCDLVICEGFKSSDLPKIEVFRKSLGEEPLYPRLTNVVAVVSDTEFPGVKNFSLKDAEGVADFIEEEFIKNEEGIELFVNGKKVPMKRFVRLALTETLLGFLRALDHIDRQIKSVEIKIRPESVLKG